MQSRHDRIKYDRSSVSGDLQELFIVHLVAQALEHIFNQFTDKNLIIHSGPVVFLQSFWRVNVVYLAGPVIILLESFRVERDV